MNYTDRPTTWPAHLYDMQFGDYDAEADLSPQALAFGLRLYAEARQAYEAAGMPLGPDDEAMLVWFTFDPAAGEHHSEVSEN